jgi:hypothetical protein
MMYDNVDLKLSTDNITDTELESFKHSLQYLNTSFRNEENQTEYFRSTEFNFKVSITSNYIRLYAFSLPSLLFGTNERSFEFSCTNQAIKKITEVTQLPMERAFVTRVDVASNFNVKQEPISYFNILDTTRNFSLRIPYPNSLNYQQKTNRKRLIFYDKKIERASKGYSLVNEHNHSLRYELKLIKSPHKTLKRDSIKLADLANKTTQIALLKLWKKEYDLINKVDTNACSFSYPIQTPKELIEYLAWLQFSNNEVRTSTYNHINKWVSSGTLGRKFKENTHRKLNEINMKYSLFKSTRNSLDLSLANELNLLLMNKFDLLIGGIKGNQ